MSCTDTNSRKSQIFFKTCIDKIIYAKFQWSRQNDFFNILKSPRLWLISNSTLFIVKKLNNTVYINSKKININIYYL